MASQSKKPKNKDAQLVDLFHHCAHVAVHRGNRSGGRSGTLSALLKTGPVSQRELAEVMNVRAATLSEQIARLDRAGLVERTPSEKDRRSVIVSLSEEGKKEARRCSRERTKYNEQLFSVLSDDDKAELISLLEKLSDHWSESNLDGGKEKSSCASCPVRTVLCGRCRSDSPLSLKGAAFNGALHGHRASALTKRGPRIELRGPRRYSGFFATCTAAMPPV